MISHYSLRCSGAYVTIAIQVSAQTIIIKILGGFSIQDALKFLSKSKDILRKIAHVELFFNNLQPKVQKPPSILFKFSGSDTTLKPKHFSRQNSTEKADWNLRENPVLKAKCNYIQKGITEKGTPVLDEKKAETINVIDTNNL